MRGRSNYWGTSVVGERSSRAFNHSTEGWTKGAVWCLRRIGRKEGRVNEQDGRTDGWKHFIFVSFAFGLGYCYS